MIVPFTRVLKKGSKGRDVLAVQRALARAGYRKWGVGFTGVAGQPFVDQIRRFQRQHKLPTTGTYTRATHEKMRPYFDRYGANLMVKAKRAQGGTGSSGRDAAVHAAMEGYNYRGHIHYTQGPARMDIVRHKRMPPWHGDIWEDCSSSVTAWFWIGKLPDPNHLGYNGQGYTGTLAVHGVRVTFPKPGDFAFYKPPYPYGHVAMCVGYQNGVPMVVSHGGESGPSYVPWNYRGDFSHWRRY